MLSSELQFWATCLKQSQLCKRPCPPEGHANMGKFHIKGYLCCFLLILVKPRQDNSIIVMFMEERLWLNELWLGNKFCKKEERNECENLKPKSTRKWFTAVLCGLCNPKAEFKPVKRDLSLTWMCLVHHQHEAAVPTVPAALPSAEWPHLRFTSQHGQLNQADEADESSQRTN